MSLVTRCPGLALVTLIVAGIADLTGGATAAAEPVVVDEGAATPTVAAATPAAPPRITVHGYLRPELVVAYRPAAADELTAGAGTSRVGITLVATPQRGLYATVVAVVGGERADAARAGDAVDRDGDGQADDVAVVAGGGFGLGITEASVTFEARRGVTLGAGRARLPLSQADLADGAGFPARVPLGSQFVAEPDLGLWSRLATRTVVVQAGVWNGTGRDALAPAGERGPVAALRLDWRRGAACDDDVDLAGGGLRVGIGASVAYRASRVEDAGHLQLRRRDLRAAIGARAAWAHAVVQVEALRRQVTDDLSSRPLAATGVTLTGSWLTRLGRGGVAALGRVGWLDAAQLSMPHAALTAEAALAYFPRLTGPRAGAMRGVVGWARDVDADTQEVSQRLVVQVRLAW